MILFLMVLRWSWWVLFFTYAVVVVVVVVIFLSSSTWTEEDGASMISSPRSGPTTCRPIKFLALSLLLLPLLIFLIPLFILLMLLLLLILYLDSTFQGQTPTSFLVGDTKAVTTNFCLNYETFQKDQAGNSCSEYRFYSFP